MNEYQSSQSFELGELGEVTYKENQYQFLSIRQCYGRDFIKEAKRITNDDLVFHKLVDDTHVFIFKKPKFIPKVPQGMTPESKDFKRLRDEAGTVFVREWGLDHIK